MKINVTVKYAIQLLKFLNGKSSPVTLKMFADEHELSLSLTEQVARKLRIYGLVKVKRGPGGGLILAKTLNLINLFEVDFALKSKSEQMDVSEIKFNRHLEKLMIYEM